MTAMTTLACVRGLRRGQRGRVKSKKTILRNLIVRQEWPWWVERTHALHRRDATRATPNRSTTPASRLCVCQ